MFIDPNGLENIVISGGDEGVYHDYKFNFIGPAIRAIKEYKSKNKKEDTTWFVYKDKSYTSQEMRNIETVADDEGVNLVWFENKKEIISYMNTKGTGDTKERVKDRITDMAIFSHGYAMKLAFIPDRTDSSDNTIAGEFFTKEDIAQIKRGVFSANGVTCFYSCNTGTGSKKGNSKDSFAQEWSNHFGVTSYAVVDDRTDYSQINKGKTPEQKFNRKAFWGFFPEGSNYYPTPDKPGNVFTKFEPEWD